MTKGKNKLLPEEARKRLFASLWSEYSSASGAFRASTSSFDSLGRSRWRGGRSQGGHETDDEDDEEEEGGGDDMGKLSREEKEFLREVSRNQIEEVESYLLRGVDVHTRNGFGRDGMQIAVRNGYINMMDMLASWGGLYSSVGPNKTHYSILPCSMANAEP